MRGVPFGVAIAALLSVASCSSDSATPTTIEPAKTVVVRFDTVSLMSDRRTLVVVARNSPQGTCARGQSGGVTAAVNGDAIVVEVRRILPEVTPPTCAAVCESPLTEQVTLPEPLPTSVTFAVPPSSAQPTCGSDPGDAAADGRVFAGIGGLVIKALRVIRWRLGWAGCLRAVGLLLALGVAVSGCDSTSRSPNASRVPLSVKTTPIGGRAQPDSVRRGESFVLTPSQVVDVLCGKFAVVFDSRRGSSAIGTLSTTGEWRPATATGITVPACAVPASAAAVRYVVGDQVPTGPIVVCLTFDFEPAACAGVSVLP